MKAKLLRRVLCVALCAAVLACSCVNALGAELFEGDGIGDTTAYAWANRSAYAVSFSWLNLNIPNTSGGLTSGNLSAGVQVWGSALAETVPRLAPVQTNTTDWPSTSWIANCIPTEEFFQSLYAGAGTDWREYAARTVVYSTLGHEIVRGYVASTDIASAYIYYNPLLTASSGNNWTNTVAHELGHCMGFGHSTDSSSIMNERNTSYVSLPDTDKNAFLNKY